MLIFKTDNKDVNENQGHHADRSPRTVAQASGEKARLMPRPAVASVDRARKTSVGTEPDQAVICDAGNHVAATVSRRLAVA